MFISLSKTKSRAYSSAYHGDPGNRSPPAFELDESVKLSFTLNFQENITIPISPKLSWMPSVINRRQSSVDVESTWLHVRRCRQWLSLVYIALGDERRAVAKFSKSLIWDKVSEGSTLVFGDAPMTLKHNVG